MKKLFTIYLLLLSVAALFSQPSPRLLHFRQLTVKDGLPHNGIIALGEDGEGRLWVATYGGLCMYDGFQFTPLTTDGLPDRRIDRINRDKDGKMWVQCFHCHDKVSRYDEVSGRFVTLDTLALPDSLRRQAAALLNRTFADTHTTRQWTVRQRRLWQTDTMKTGSQFDYSGQTAADAGLSDATVFTLLLDSRGTLWVGSENSGLFFADTKQGNYRRIVCRPTTTVKALCTDRQGTLWMGIGHDGLKAVVRGEKGYRDVALPLKDSVEGRRIRTILEDSHNRLWVGTHDGLYYKEDSCVEFRRLDMTSFLYRWVYSLCEDRQQNLWVGTDKGLFRLDTDEEADTTMTFVLSMAAADDGLWMAAEHGLYSRRGSETRQWSDSPARCVACDALGQVWAGTDNGLLRVVPQGLQHIPTPADGHIVKSLLVWRDFLWCCYDQGLFVVNSYTNSVTLLRMEYNEYVDGAACVDATTGTLFFAGTQGIDAVCADSLESQLRTAPRYVWLDEVNEELRMKSEAPASAGKWWWWIFALVAASIAVGGIVATKRKKHCITAASAPEPLFTPETQEDHDNPVVLSPFVAKATAFVDAHLSDMDLTAEQMAREMAMSRTKLFETMKAETGKAVMEFVRDQRLAYAAKHLKEGATISEVTYSCGFSDPSSFRRAFVKKYGVTPSQYKGGSL